LEKALVRDWKSALNADPVDWLLEHENPSVRYFPLKDIVDLSDQDLEVEENKNSIRCDEKVTKIFSKQKSGDIGNQLNSRICLSIRAHIGRL
jgi:hypothetical protein